MNLHLHDHFAQTFPKRDESFGRERALTPWKEEGWRAKDGISAYIYLCSIRIGGEARAKLSDVD